MLARLSGLALRQARTAARVRISPAFSALSASWPHFSTDSTATTKTLTEQSKEEGKKDSAEKKETGAASGNQKTVRKRRKFNFAPAIDLEPDAEKALSLLAGMKEGAIGVRASYVPVKVDMRFTFDFIFDSEKQHRFDEVIPLQGDKILMIDGATLPKMLGRILTYNKEKGTFDLKEKISETDRVTIVAGPESARSVKRPPTK